MDPVNEEEVIEEREKNNTKEKRFVENLDLENYLNLKSEDMNFLKEKENTPEDGSHLLT